MVENIRIVLVPGQGVGGMLVEGIDCNKQERTCQGKDDSHL